MVRAGLLVCGSLALGCGGRIAADDEASPASTRDAAVDEVALGHIDTGVVEDPVGDAEGVDGGREAGVWDGSVARCVGRGNYAYAWSQIDSDPPRETTIEGVPWRVFWQGPDLIDLGANPSSGHGAFFKFASPTAGEPLRVATYEDATLVPAVPGHPGLLAWFLDAGNCSDLKGRFVIHALEWNGETSATKRRVTKLVATFETNCYLLKLKGCMSFEQSPHVP